MAARFPGRLYAGVQRDLDVGRSLPSGPAPSAQVQCAD